MNKKVLLSTLWILAVFNYIFRFLFSLYYSERLQQLLRGSMHGMEITQGFLLAISVMMEISIMMILLSRLLKYKASRLMNILCALIMLAIHAATLSPTGAALHYYFFSAVEIALYISIICFAVIWKAEQNNAVSSHS